MNEIMYGIYDTRDNDICIGVFTPKDLLLKLGIDSRALNRYLKKERLYRYRYKIEELILE